MKCRVLKIHPDDNLIVALDNLQIGETIELDGIHYPIKEKY